MDSGSEPGIGSTFTIGRGLGTVTDAILEPSCSEVHAHEIRETRVRGEVAAGGRDDFDVPVDGPGAA